MIDKLRLLEQKIADLTTQYNVVATELANLKNKPNNDDKYEYAIKQLTAQFEQSQSELLALQNTQKQAREKIDQLAQENSKFIGELSVLREENHSLKEKNRIAIERAELIQSWLSNIDHAKNG